MLENKDQEIKVFGWMLQLGSKSDGEKMSGSKMVASASTDVSCECTTFDENLLCSKQSKPTEIEGCSTVELMEMNQEDESCTSSSLEECKTPSSVITKTSSINQNSSTQDHLVQRKDDHQTSDATDTPKKPEEILPCPRCNSMNTKFCYFNNYNVNQPRHFCKNCQRYWTAGGCMRNVAVGSGRRKSKTSHTSFQPDSPTGPTFWPMRPNSGDATSQNSPMRPKMGNPMENEGGTYPTASNWPTYGWSPIPWQSGYHPQWVCHFVPNPPINPNPNSQPSLGKHSRDGTLLVPSNNPNNTIPGTLRIVDDPIEVSRSSVWGSLEVEKDKARTSNIGSGFFWGLERKEVDSNTSGEGSHLATQANPAASRRSLSFHEVGEQGCNKKC